MKERNSLTVASKPNASTLTGRSTTMLMSTLLRWHLDLVLLGAVLTGLALLLRAWAIRAHGATVPLRELVPMLILVLVATEVYAQVNTRREVSRMEYMLVDYVQT